MASVRARDQGEICIYSLNSHLRDRLAASHSQRPCLLRASKMVSFAQAATPCQSRLDPASIPLGLHLIDAPASDEHHSCLR